MSTALKNLGGGSYPTANALTNLYTVPSNTTAVVSSVAFCNQSGASIKVRLSHAIAGAADTPKQYVFYDVVVPANQTFVATMGIAMAATDVLRVQVSGNCSVNAWGQENS